MSAPKVTKGLPWIRVYTSMLNDDDLLDCSDAGRLLAVVLMLWSADQGTNGVVPSSARRVQRFAHLDAGEASCERGLQELIEAGFLVGHDSGGYLIRSYGRYQLEANASNRAESNREAAFRQHHAAGKHADRPREGCPECTNSDTDPEPPTPPAVAPVAPVQEPEALEPVEMQKLSSSVIRKEFVKTFPGVFETNTRLDGYRLLLTEAVRVSADCKDMAPNLEGNLKNSILADALLYYIDSDMDQKTINACNRGAKALSDQDGHFWWILAAQASATQQWENERHIIRWLTKVAASKRSEWLGGAA